MTTPVPDNGPTPPTDPVPASTGSTLDPSKQPDSARERRSLWRRLRRFDFGLLALFVMAAAVLADTHLWPFHFVFRDHYHLDDVENLVRRRFGEVVVLVFKASKLVYGNNLWPYLFGAIWGVGCVAVALSPAISIDQPQSARTRRSLAWQRRSVILCLVGFITLTLIVIYGIHLYRITAPDRRNEVFDGVAKNLEYAWIGGIAAIAVGHGVSLLAARRHLHRLLLLATLWIDYEGFRYWSEFHEQPMTYRLYGLYAFFLSSALFTGYLERAARVLQLEYVWKLARAAVLLNLLYFAGQAVILTFREKMLELPKFAFEIAYHSAWPLALVANGLQICVLVQIAMQCKTKLQLPPSPMESPPA